MPCCFIIRQGPGGKLKLVSVAIPTQQDATALATSLALKDKKEDVVYCVVELVACVQSKLVITAPTEPTAVTE